MWALHPMPQPNPVWQEWPQIVRHHRSRPILTLIMSERPSWVLPTCGGTSMMAVMKFQKTVTSILCLLERSGLQVLMLVNN